METTNWKNAFKKTQNFHFIVNVMLDHVREYEIDGLCYDYIRIQGGLGKKETEEEYKRVYGRNLREDINDPKRMLEFTRYCIDDIVRRTTEGARKIRPDILISMWGRVRLKREGLASNGRNPHIWVEKGWVDVVYNGDYGKRLGIEIMDAARRESSRPYAYVEALGNFDKTGDTEGSIPRDAELLAKQVDYCRKKYNDGNGIFVYFYGKLSDEQIKALRKDPFKELAKPHWRR